jgi:glycosyltransferase involved in cell wall biosynthesis
MALDKAIVSAVIRAKDKASTIREAIATVKSQTVPVEVIVVDSGSHDATPEIAREMGARVLSIPAEMFTYGSAINAGVAAAHADYVLVLSAHCELPGPHWLELALQHFEDDRVVGVNGTSIHDVRRSRHLSPEQRLIVGAMDDIVVQDRPFYDGFAGFSNSCALVRRSAASQFRFDEKMIYAEDKEWANRVTQAGYLIVFDAALGTFHDHILKEGYRSRYRRGYKAGEALTQLFGHRAWTLRRTAERAGLVLRTRTGKARVGFLHPANLVDYAGRISGSRHASRP